MHIETFPFLKDHTCLLTHDGRVYKLKLLYGRLDSTVKQTLSKRVSKQNAHCEIEDAFRSVLYMLERDQELCTIQTDHFIITPGTRPWALKNKIIFKVKDKTLHLYPDFITFKIQCKHLFERCTAYHRAERKRTSTGKDLQKPHSGEANAIEEHAKARTCLLSDRKADQSKVIEDNLLQKLITRHGLDELSKSRSCTVVLSTPDVRTDQVEGSLSPQKVCQLSRIMRHIQDKVSKDESKSENKNTSYHVTDMRSESHTRNTRTRVLQSKRLLRSAAKTDEKDSCFNSSTEVSYSETSQEEMEEKGDTDNAKNDDRAISNDLDASKCAYNFKDRNEKDEPIEDRESGIFHSSEQETANVYNISSKKRWYRKACNRKRNRNAVSRDTSEEGTFVKEASLKYVGDRTVPLKRKNKEAMDNIRLEKLLSDVDTDDMSIQLVQNRQNNKNESSSADDLVDESDEHCSDTEIAVVTERILLPRTSALNARTIKSCIDTDYEFTSKKRRISPRRAENAAETCDDSVPPQDKNMIKTNKNKYFEVCTTGTSMTYSRRNKSERKPDKTGKRAESSHQLNSSLIHENKYCGKSRKKYNRIKLKNRTNQRISSLPSDPVANRLYSDHYGLRKRNGNNIARSEFKDKDRKCSKRVLVSKTSQVSNKESKKKRENVSVLKSSVKNSRTSQSIALESTHINRSTRSVSHDKASKHHSGETRSHSLPRQRIQQLSNSVPSSPEKKHRKIEVTPGSVQMKNLRSSQSVCPVSLDKSNSNNDSLKCTESDSSSISLRPRKATPLSPKKAQDLRATCKRLLAEKDSVWIFGSASKSQSQKGLGKKSSSYHLRHQRQVDRSNDLLKCTDSDSSSVSLRPRKVIPTSQTKAQNLKATCTRLLAEKDSVWIFGNASKSPSQKDTGKKPSSSQLRHQGQVDRSCEFSCASPKHSSKTFHPPLNKERRRQPSGIWNTVKGIFAKSKE